VYPTLALFNHSCDPTVMRQFIGKTAILKSLKNCKKNEELADNYGPMFTYNDMDTRKSTLKTHYWFDCTCDACGESWETFSNLSDEFVVRCESCYGLLRLKPDAPETNSCDCGEETLIQTKPVLDKFKSATELLHQKDSNKAAALYREVLKLLDDMQVLPCSKIYQLAKEGLYRCHINNLT